ncbi:MAG: hypothetical protein LUQ69_10655 [Methanoregulaceae archaeon]|nr:hypothetical protein [Methanoregulaceae archaeon]
MSERLCVHCEAFCASWNECRKNPPKLVYADFGVSKPGAVWEHPKTTIDGWCLEFTPKPPAKDDAKEEPKQEPGPQYKKGDRVFVTNIILGVPHEFTVTRTRHNQSRDCWEYELPDGGWIYEWALSAPPHTCGTCKHRNNGNKAINYCTAMTIDSYWIYTTPLTICPPEINKWEPRP